MWINLDFNPHQTKGVYLAYDGSDKECFSKVGLPGGKPRDIPEKYDWMMRLVITQDPPRDVSPNLGAWSATREPQQPTLPPVVVTTVPKSGDTEVDPATTEIRASFSKDMMTDRMWSWVQVSDETFPQTTGDVHYLPDKRTCVLPVRLEPAKTYVIWINSEKFDSFRDTEGIPAVPYLLTFQTRK